MKRIKDIRAAVVDRLKDADIPRIGDRVFPHRFTKAWPDELPALFVYCVRTTFEGRDRQPRNYQATTSLQVEALVKGDYTPPPAIPGDPPGEPVSLADQLSDLSQAVIEAMIYPWDSEIRDHTEPPLGPLGGLVSDIVLDDMNTSGSDEGTEEAGAEVVAFSLYWNQILPDIEPPDDFKKMGLTVAPPINKKAPALTQTVVEDMGD